MNDTPPPPHSARCPDAASVAEIQHRGGAYVPEFLGESAKFLGDADIDYARYTSREFMHAEFDRMWSRVWQFACREEQIPLVHDYIVYDIGRWSVIVVRGADGHIRAFHNSCMHRGTKLRPSGTDGNAEELRCPFHGWAWHSDGRLKEVICPWDFPHVSPESHGLRPVRVDFWGGFVFVTFDDHAKPLRDYMEVIPGHAEHLRMQDRYIAAWIRKELPSNWKAAQEAFIEAYHVLATHPQLVKSVADANGQYDIYGDHVSRRLGTMGVPSPHLKNRMTEQDILDFLSGDARTQTGERLIVPPGGTARDVMTAHFRRTTEATYNVDLSSFADAEVVDTIEYHLFPNMMIFPAFLLSMVYRFLPVAHDPDRSTFEIMLLRPVGQDGRRPEAPALQELGPDDSFTTVPELGEAFGHVFDQDTGNLRLQQEGFYTLGKRGQTLGNYQEVRTRHLHQTLDKYLSGAL